MRCTSKNNHQLLSEENAHEVFSKLTIGMNQTQNRSLVARRVNLSAPGF